MRILSKESFSVIQQLMPDNYSNLYSRISLTLPSEAAACFAKYTQLTGQNSGQWSIDCPGENEYKPIAAAAPFQRMAAKDTIDRLTQTVKAAGIVADPAKLLSVPDDSCIFFRQLPTGEVSVVFTQWGYRRVGASSAVNNISLLIGGPGDGLDRSDVTLKLTWSDGTPMTNTPVKVNIYGGVFEKMTDAEGKVNLGNVAEGEQFTVDVDGQKTVAKSVGSGLPDYPITYPYRVNAVITFLNDKEIPQRDAINVNGTPIYPDSNGRVELNDILLTPGAVLNVDYQGNDPQSFTLNRDSRLNDFKYVVAIPEPPQLDLPPQGPPMPPVEEPAVEEPPLPSDKDNDLNVRIRLVDKKKRPLTYTRVKVELQKGFDVLVSDGDGYIFVERKAFTQGERVKIEVFPDAPDKIPVTPNTPPAVNGEDTVVADTSAYPPNPAPVYDNPPAMTPTPEPQQQQPTVGPPPVAPAPQQQPKPMSQGGPSAPAPATPRGPQPPVQQPSPTPQMRPDGNAVRSPMGSTVRGGVSSREMKEGAGFNPRTPGATTPPGVPTPPPVPPTPNS